MSQPPSSESESERTPLLPAPSSSKPTYTPSPLAHEIGSSGISHTSVGAGGAGGEGREEDPLAPTKEEKRRSLIRWSVFWVLVGILVIVLVVEAFERGGGEFDWIKALKEAGGGGLSGAMAMVIQVLTLMPLRTVMNYQYRFGGTMMGSIKHLYSEGGYARYYHGLGPALFQGPISRFGDTAANAGILALLSSNPFLNQLPSPAKTAFGSLAAALFRMILVPVDTLKTTMQTQGANGVQILRDRIRTYGVGTMWYGAWATAAATFVGNYPWFATYNWLGEALPPPETFPQKLLRQAFIGFVASVVSDTISNSLRVVKTYRQVNKTRVSYTTAAKAIVAEEGWLGLFGRGLGTRILANGLQGLMFSVLWRLFQDMLRGDEKK